MLSLMNSAVSAMALGREITGGQGGESGLLCKIVRPRKCFTAVWTRVWSFLSMSPHVPTRPG